MNATGWQVLWVFLGAMAIGAGLATIAWFAWFAPFYRRDDR